MVPSFDAHALRLTRDSGAPPRIGRKPVGGRVRSGAMNGGSEAVDEQRRAAIGAQARDADLALVRRVLTGDELAFEALRQRLARLPAMLRHQDARLGRPLNETELEDVLRDTVAALWAKLATFEGRASLETWMYRFAALELLKAVQRKCRAPQSLEDPWSAPDPAPDEALAAERDIDRAELEQALAALTAGAAEVIRMRHFDELVFEEIAARVQLPLNTVKARYYRGLARLKEILMRRHRRGGP